MVELPLWLCGRRPLLRPLLKQTSGQAVTCHRAQRHHLFLPSSLTSQPQHTSNHRRLSLRVTHSFNQGTQPTQRNTCQKGKPSHSLPTERAKPHQALQLQGCMTSNTCKGTWDTPNTEAVSVPQALSKQSICENTTQSTTQGHLATQTQQALSACCK
jgi:hypothetical protein